MTGKLIFKMELFKFLRDKSFLITAGVIGVLNIILSLFALSAVSAFSDSYYESSTTAALLGTMGVIGFIVIFGNIIFAYVYPFHMISMDYKNNVMAMMVASGVNRRKLFFAKIGAIFICTIALMLLIALIPMILFLVKLVQLDGWDSFVEGLNSMFYYTELSFGKLIFSGLLSYLNMLMVIATACIIMKGKNLSFLLFIGFNILSTFVTGILSMISFSFDFSVTGSYIFQLFLTVVSIVVFGYISLRTLEKQNL
jgi:ABC-type transport system involved in multi-copper enzyme maturation permease subunit